MMITQKKIKTMLTFAAVAMAIFLTAGSASALDNSGFETPDQGDSGYTNPYPPTGVDGWTFTGGSGLSGPNGPWKCNSTSPDPLGDQFAYLQGLASISQDLTGLAVGVTYNLSFFESYRTAMLPSNDLSVILDEGLGTEVTIYNNPGVTNSTWEERQTDVFLMAKASYTLTFRTTNPLGGDRSTLIDGVLVNVYDPMQPSPEDGEKVPPANPLTLSWTNLDPNTVPRPPVFVDVWFGTDPEALAQVPGVSGVADANSVAVDASAVGVYYWRVDSYLGGSPTGDPNVGTLWTFSTDFPPSSVEILTPDMITWSGRGVDLDGTFVDDSDSLDWTIAWSADPDAGVVFLPNANDLTPTVEITAPPHRVVREIQVEGDDTEEHVNIQAISGSSYAQGGIDLASSDLEVGAEGDGGLDWQVCAVQYDQLGIPQGATITGAKITFTVDNSGAAGTSNDFTIYAEAADDASVFSTDPFDVTDRALSTASVPWAPAASPAVGTKIDTPDITGLIQEVVDRAGWSDNSRLTLMIYPDVYLASPTGGSTTVQEIEFEAGPGSDSATLTVGYESTDSFDPVTVTLTLGVNDVINPEAVTDTMTIDVYDTRCRAANGAGQLDPADFDENCIVNLADLVIFLDEFLTCTTPNVPGCVETYRP